MLHRTLERFLKKLDLTVDSAPGQERWEVLLRRLDTAFGEADENRYTLERSLQLVSEEMRDLYRRQRESFEARQRAILDAQPDLIFMLNEHGRYLEVMAGDPDKLVRPASELIGANIANFLPQDLVSSILATIGNALNNHSMQIMEYSLQVPVGKLSFEGRIVPVDLTIDGCKVVVFLARDITERKQAEAALRDNLEKYRALVEMTQDFVWEVDANGVYTYCSPQSLTILGYRPDEIVGKTPFDLMPPDVAERVARRFRDFLERQSPFNSLENVNLHKNGHPVVLETGGVPFFDETGRLAGFRGIDRDISDRKRAAARLEQLARFDQLTQLPNRHLFSEELTQRLLEAERLNEQLALLFIDLDHFKIINDSMGHDAGDNILRQVAARFSAQLRPYDTLARFAGDEFVLLLPHVRDNGEAASVAEKLLKNLEPPFDINGQEAFVSGSIGISIFPHDGLIEGELLQHADTAMYRAKEAGRRRYCFFTRAMNEELRRHQQIADRLRSALGKQEFQLLYQPLVDLQTGKIESCEALLRWIPADGDQVQPGEFIPVAEKSDLIDRIGEWVFNEACRQRAEWRQEALADIRIFINLSGRQLGSLHFYDWIQAALQRHGLRFEDIGIELTENVLIDTDKNTLSQLRALHDAGLQIAIDDFGTGYSSLSYLKRFPVDSLKIDREFMRDAADDPDDRAIMKAIVGIGHSLGLIVVVEGVETEQQSAIARELSCDKVQGFLFHKPMPADALAALLKTPQ